MFKASAARQPPLPSAVGVHDVDRALAERRRPGGNPVADEGDPPPVGRPGRTRLLSARFSAINQPALPAAVGVHDVDNAAITADGRLADEGDLRARRCGGKARPCGECRGSSLGLRAPSEQREERDSDERDEGHDCPVAASATLRALPRFLDQRLDEGLELLASTGSLGRGGRGGAVTVTAASLTQIALVLLAPC